MCSHIRKFESILCIAPSGDTISLQQDDVTALLLSKQSAMCLQHVCLPHLPKCIIDCQHFMLQLLPECRVGQVPISKVPSFTVRKEGAERTRIVLFFLDGHSLTTCSSISAPLVHTRVHQQAQQSTWAGSKYRPIGMLQGSSSKKEYFVFI